MTFLDLALWAQTRTTPQAPSGGQIMLFVIGGLVCSLLVVIPFIIAGWRIFTKAGEPGWASLVPVYNAMVMGRICGRGEMFGLLTLIPCVGAIFGIMLTFDLARVFGKSTGFAVGLLLLSPIFILMLAFGDARYVGDRPVRGRRRRDDYDDEDEDDDRPRRRPAADVRARPRDEDDDRPRRRPAPRGEDDDDDRPRRRPRDDDEDDDRPRRRPGR